MEQPGEVINMSVDLLQNISLISFIVAGVFLLLSLVLFFLLDVPKIIGDLSGATARKAIESIRQQNEDSGDKAYKPSPVNLSRGKLTDKISQSGHLVHNSNPLGVAVGTEELSQDKINKVGNETTLLSQSGNETTILSSNETTILSSGSSETTVLSEMPVTGSYQSVQIPVPLAENVGNITVEVELSNLGSSEIIE